MLKSTGLKINKHGFPNPCHNSHQLGDFVHITLTLNLSFLIYKIILFLFLPNYVVKVIMVMGLYYMPGTLLRILPVFPVKQVITHTGNSDPERLSN